MAISSYVGAEIVAANNTFQTWLDRTNSIIGDMGSTVISVGDNNTGNVTIDGVFSANTIYAGTELRGGDANAASAFVISSNVNFTGANTTISSGLAQLTGNVAINGATKQLTVSTIKTTISSANTIISGFTQFGDSITIDGGITANGDLDLGVGGITAAGDLNLGGDLVVSGNATFTSEVTFSTNVQSFAVPTGNTAQRPDPASAGMFRFNTELEEFEGYDGTLWGLIGGGGGLAATVITSNTNVAAEGFYFTDTSGGSFTVTLPASPDAGDVIKLAGKTWATNVLTVARNGNTIEGFADDFELDIEDSFVEFVYDGSTWQVFTNVISTAGSGGGLLEPIIMSTNQSLSSGQFIYADTTGGSITLSLPASPTAGDYIKVIGTGWATNNLTLDRNGATIEGASESLIVDLDDVTIDLIHDGTTWQVFANIGGGNPIAVQDATGNTEFNVIMTTESANGVFSTVSVDTTMTYNPLSSTLTAVNITANTVTATDFNSLSDVTAKDNINPIPNVMSTLMNLNPVEFTWKDNGSKSYGVLAQELEAILPELVTQGKDKKYVNYIPLIALLLEGYKDLVKKIDSLENK